MTDDPIFLKALGARILNEANDLKRTPAALARELKVSPALVDAVIAGNAATDAARELVLAMAAAYPISLADIWLEADDTDAGVRIMRAAASKASSRVFERKDRTGSLAPYYEYRDTAMSRSAPFKPEWILELRTVDDADPYNPDVAFNNGHFLHQQTFFIGPVNFYWEVGGKRYCAEMATGDSNYITPFVPHSFASRDPNNRGLIIAATYGADVRRAFRELAYVEGDAMISHAGNLRTRSPFALRLERQLRAESLSIGELISRLVGLGLDAARVRALIEDATPTEAEIVLMARALSIRPQDLVASSATPGDDVVMVRRAAARERGHPDGNRPAYRLTELARSRHQPMLKGFDVTVLGQDDGALCHGLHEYLYNYGSEPVEIHWTSDRRDILEPGDSAYVRPLVTHRFARARSAGEGRLVMLRVPGALTDSALDEFAIYAESGRARAIKETKPWF
jgi:hypothetical protein